jgi:hypothetical protein
MQGSRTLSAPSEACASTLRADPSHAGPSCAHRNVSTFKHAARNQNCAEPPVDTARCDCCNTKEIGLATFLKETSDKRESIALPGTGIMVHHVHWHSYRICRPVPNRPGMPGTPANRYPLYLGLGLALSGKPANSGRPPVAAHVAEQARGLAAPGCRRHNLPQKKLLCWLLGRSAAGCWCWCWCQFLVPWSLVLGAFSTSPPFSKLLQASSFELLPSLVLGAAAFGAVFRLRVSGLRSPGDVPAQFPWVLVGPPSVRKCHQMSSKEHMQLGWVVRWVLSTPPGHPTAGGWAAQPPIVSQRRARGPAPDPPRNHPRVQGEKKETDSR